MEESRQDILRRLEKAIDEWNREVGETDDGPLAGPDTSRPIADSPHSTLEIPGFETAPTDSASGQIASATVLNDLMHALISYCGHARAAARSLQMLLDQFPDSELLHITRRHRATIPSAVLRQYNCRLSAFDGLLRRIRRDLSALKTSHSDLCRIQLHLEQAASPRSETLPEGGARREDLQPADGTGALIKDLRALLEEYRNRSEGPENAISARIEDINQRVEAMQPVMNELQTAMKEERALLERVDARLDAGSLEETAGGGLGEGQMTQLRDAVTALNTAAQAQSSRVEAVHESIRNAHDHLSRVSEQLEPLTALDQTLQKLLERFDSIEQHFFKDQQRLSRLEQQLTEAMAERDVDSAVAGQIQPLVQAFREMQSYAEPVLMEHADSGLQGPTPPTQERLDALRNRMDGLGEQMTEVVERLNQLEHSVSEAPDIRTALQNVMTRELTQALRERDEAQDEIARLRSEVATLRKANESLHEPPYDDPGEGGQSSEVGSLKAYDESGQRRRMGEMLVKAGVITGDQLEAALNDQTQHPYRRLGAILTGKGFAQEDEVARALACQMEVPFMRLTKSTVDPEATKMITGRVAAHHACIPVQAQDDELVLAMINPLDLIAIEDVELASGARVKPVVSTPTDIERAVRHFYGVSVTV